VNQHHSQIKHWTPPRNELPDAERLPAQQPCMHVKFTWHTGDAVNRNEHKPCEGVGSWGGAIRQYSREGCHG